MHQFARFFLEDLENARNELLPLFDKLTAQQWKRKIPGGKHDIHELANHVLSDTQRLAILAPIVGINDLFPAALQNDRYACIWEDEKTSLSPENILLKNRYERNKLRTILALSTDNKQAKKFYESNFPTGWHERMHLFDLQQALVGEYESMPTPQDSKIRVEKLTEQLGIMAFLYDIDVGKIDEIAQTNQAYRQEIKMLAQGKFVDAIHRWTGISDHMPRLKGSADITQQIHHIHGLCNDMIAHARSLNTEQLATIIDGKPLMKRIQRIVLDFQTKISLFKKISLRDSWARKASL